MGELAQPWHALRYVVIDIEGNGGRPVEVVEFAAAEIKDGVVAPPRSWLVRPTSPITWQARRVHGISNDMVTYAPEIGSLSQEITDLVANRIVIGHNLRFDMAVLRGQLPGFRVDYFADTLRLARRIYPDLPSHRLGALANHLGITCDLPGLYPHRAAYDVVITAKLFIHLATNENGSPKTIGDLAVISGPATPTSPQLGLFD